jgi:predicted transcriptional regulator
VSKNSETIAVEAVDYIRLSANIVAAYVSNNHVQPSEIGTLVASTYAALTRAHNAGETGRSSPRKPTPAQIRQSITPDALISFEDGKLYKTLRRHLTIRGLSPAEYRAKWGLPVDYPMTAASYSERRSALAVAIGLGQGRPKAASEAQWAAEPVTEKPKRRGRPRKVKASAEA